MKKSRLLPLLLGLALTASLLAGCGGKSESTAEAAEGSTELKKIVIAEPVHSTGYLPLYLAQREGYFKKRGLDVEVIQAAGGAHVTAVVSGDAWGVIGGTESNALANKKNSDPIVSIVNVVNRANVYLVAQKGLAPAGNSEADLKEFFKGKKINAGRHGGTPNLLIRYLLIYLGLDPEKDVTLLEPADASTVVTMVQQGAADIGNGAEPQISDGISKDVWGEPFYKFHDFGDFSYSVLSVKKSTIEKDPETVQLFTDAIIEALKAVQEDKELAMKNMKAEFPTLSDDAIQASLDRAYADNLWSRDGFITEAAVKQDMDVLIKTGIYTGDYSYDQLVDMQFVNSSK